MKKANSLKFKQLNQAVHHALRSWHDLSDDADTLLDSLILVQDQQIQMVDRSPAVLRLATNQVLQSNIDELATHDAQASHILQWRFFDNETSLAVANRLGLSEDQVKRYQRKALQQLTHIILENETIARRERAQILEAELLPATYTALFGIDEVCAHIVKKVLTNASPWVLCLTGIGGIGKTALADKVARQLIRTFHFESVIWLRMTPGDTTQDKSTPMQMWDNVMGNLAHYVCPHLPKDVNAKERNLQIRQVLKTLPYFIIVDNLESETDTAYFLAQLGDLSGPSKFLITTRVRSKEQAGILNITLPELTVDHTLELIRHHARDIGQAELAQVTKEDVQRIHSVTGGNPLALKLVVGLATVRPLLQILNDLITIQSGEVEDLYRHIYWQSWHTLSERSQTLLQMMPMAGDVGMTSEQMMQVSRLTNNELWSAINELVYFSLLEVRGSIWEKRYGIHQLTDSFLRTEIIHWPEDLP